MFLGLRTVIYPAPDLAASKAWYTALLGVDPYFDEPFYVGFDVGGYELGLGPRTDVAETYWGVTELDGADSGLLAAGAAPRSPVTEVGGGIRVATVVEPGGAALGIIENPNFRGGS